MDIYLFGAIGIGAGALMGSLARGTPRWRAGFYAASTALGYVVLEWAIQHGVLAIQDVAVLFVVGVAAIILLALIRRTRAVRKP
jgi:hypothetical protein